MSKYDSLAVGLAGREHRQILCQAMEKCMRSLWGRRDLPSRRHQRDQHTCLSGRKQTPVLMNSRHAPACLLQVYASYIYPRDLAEAVKSTHAAEAARQMTQDEHDSQVAYVGKEGAPSIPLDPPTMRQAIAWELALRSIRQVEVRILHDDSGIGSASSIAMVSSPCLVSWP